MLLEQIIATFNEDQIKELERKLEELEKNIQKVSK